ncbi:MAG: NTP transferase domain-containing protein [Angustibacter sp.]
MAPSTTSPVQVTILAAGMGTRLGRPFPKPLTPLADGRTIMQQQVDNLRAAFGEDLRLTIVVGFKHDLIMEAMPDASFVYNENFDQTNTSKSLLKSLNNSHRGPVLWLNGDVVFDPEVLVRLRPYLEQDRSVIAVNTAATSEEEVKYTIDSAGNVAQLSKSVANALGEAVGINLIAEADKPSFVRHLRDCAEQDYFERGLELAIETDGVCITPVDISDLFAVEVDFPEDLSRANSAQAEHLMTRQQDIR